jgi:hypothetical protein
MNGKPNLIVFVKMIRSYQIDMLFHQMWMHGKITEVPLFFMTMLMHTFHLEDTGKKTNFTKSSASLGLAELKHQSLAWS